MELEQFLLFIESASKRVDNISKSLMDGAYDRRDIFNYLSKNNIEPVIKVRKNFKG
jgi:hypothetical protein